MDTQPPNELRNFHRFVGEKVNNGDAALSPEEVLDLSSEEEESG